MKRFLQISSMLMALVVFLCAGPAFAQEYTDEDQTWEEALAGENAVKTDDEALKIAKDILSGPYFKLDLDSQDLHWDVRRSPGWQGKATYIIYGIHGNENNVIVILAADGSGVYIVNVNGDPFYQDWYMNRYGIHEVNPANEYAEPLSDVLNEEEQQKILDYCLALAEELAPGQSRAFREIHFNGYVQAGEELYVLLEAPSSDNSSVIFTLQVKPELRMIDYFTGNG